MTRIAAGILEIMDGDSFTTSLDVIKKAAANAQLVNDAMPDVQKNLAFVAASNFIHRRPRPQNFESGLRKLLEASKPNLSMTT